MKQNGPLTWRETRILRSGLKRAAQGNRIFHALNQGDRERAVAMLVLLFDETLSPTEIERVFGFVPDSLVGYMRGELLPMLAMEERNLKVFSADRATEELAKSILENTNVDQRAHLLSRIFLPSEYPGLDRKLQVEGMQTVFDLRRWRGDLAKIPGVGKEWQVVLEAVLEVLDEYEQSLGGDPTDKG